MKVLSRDLNWLKLIGIAVILNTTTSLSQCSRGLTHQSEYNAPNVVRSTCLKQIDTYERTGRFMGDAIAQGEFPNPYREFYSHSIRYEGDKAFHYATSKSSHLKSYVGLVVGSPNPPQPNSSQRGSAIAIVCEATKPGARPANDPSFDNSQLTCSSQTKQVGRLVSIQGQFN